MENIRNIMGQSEYSKWRQIFRELTNTEGVNAIPCVLTQRQAQIMSMYYLQQHSMADIAKEIGVNPSTVSRALESSRRKLQKVL